MHFGERLRQLREQHGLSQVVIADYLHVKPATISRYENGVNEPDMATFLWYADHFNVSVDWILGRVDEPSVRLITVSDDGKSKEVIGINKDAQLTPEMIETMRRIAKEVLEEGKLD